MEFNLWSVFRAVAAAVPDRECLVQGSRRMDYRQLETRSLKLAGLLASRGLSPFAERNELKNWQSGQATLGLYLYNCPEYLEGMLGSFAARVAPFNINYRYVEEELEYLLRDAGLSALVYHASLAPTLARVLPRLDGVELLLQVDDGSGQPLLQDAQDYERALASAPELDPGLQPSPDDLYLLYTGGTTGMPKGVLWRQADVFAAALGGTDRRGREFSSLDEIAERATGREPRVLPASPFMHGAAHWSAFSTFAAGGTVIVRNNSRGVDPAGLLETVAQERATALLIIGDAFGRPLLAELQAGNYDLPCLRTLITGGAALSVEVKQGLVEQIPGLTILDAVGSSESGNQGNHYSRDGGEVATGSFDAAPGSLVLDAELTGKLPRENTETGWFARSGRIPLGYLGDEEKTLRTFPLVDGTRYSVPGDRARWSADGRIELLGRDSVTINSGGEKIFAEEVEQALKHHAGVYDAIVVGRASERWGQEVVAVVQLAPGANTTAEELRLGCAEHIARYKLPRDWVFVDEIRRSPSGKADYAWAREQASDQVDQA